MSKSEGNFFTMKEITDKYGSDASRFASAEAGDLMDDANFTEENANEAVLKISNFEIWLKETAPKLDSMRTKPENTLSEFYDIVF